MWYEKQEKKNKIDVSNKGLKLLSAKKCNCWGLQGAQTYCKLHICYGPTVYTRATMVTFTPTIQTRCLKEQHSTVLVPSCFFLSLFSHHILEKKYKFGGNCFSRRQFSTSKSDMSSEVKRHEWQNRTKVKSM